MHEGNSEYSGNYVIEDVEVEGNQFRRLYFLSTQSVIQSDAKLKTGKSSFPFSVVLISLTYIPFI